MTQIFELCGIRWCFILFCSSLQYRSSKISPSLFVYKASCTRQFENEFSLHSSASLFPIKEGFFLPLRLSCKENSTSNQAFSIVFTTPSVPLVGDRNLRRKNVNRPTRCSEPLRSKVGGPSKVYARLCGMGPPGDNLAMTIAMVVRDGTAWRWRASPIERGSVGKYCPN